MRNCILFFCLLIITACKNTGSEYQPKSADISIVVPSNSDKVSPTGNPIEFTVIFRGGTVGDKYVCQVVSELSHTATVNGQDVDNFHHYTHIIESSIRDEIKVCYTPLDTGTHEIYITTENSVSSETSKYSISFADIPHITITGIPNGDVMTTQPFTITIDADNYEGKSFFIDSNVSSSILNLSPSFGASHPYELPLDIVITPLQVGKQNVKLWFCDDDTFDSSKTTEVSFDINVTSESNALSVQYPSEVSNGEEFDIVCSFTEQTEGDVSISVGTADINNIPINVSPNYFDGCITDSNHTVSGTFRFCANAITEYTMECTVYFTPKGSKYPIIHEKIIYIKSLKGDITFDVSDYPRTPRIGESFDVSIRPTKENYDGVFSAYIEHSDGLTFSCLETTAENSTFVLDNNKALNLTITPTAGGSHYLYLHVDANGSKSSKGIYWDAPVYLSAVSNPAGATFNKLGLYPSGKDIYFEVVPPQGYEAASCEGSKYVSNNCVYLTTPTQDTEYMVQLQKARYYVSVSASEGGSISVSQLHETYGTTHEIKAYSSHTHNFAGWYQGETLLSTNPTLSYTIPPHDSEIRAVFSPKEYRTITTAVDDSEVIRKTDVNVDMLSGGGTYEVGSTITLTAGSRNEYDAEGYSVEWWCNGKKIADTRTVDVIVTDNATYTAKYIPNMVRVTVEKMKLAVGVLITNDGEWGDAYMTMLNGKEITPTTELTCPYRSTVRFVSTPKDEWKEHWRWLYDGDENDYWVISTADLFVSRPHELRMVAIHAKKQYSPQIGYVPAEGDFPTVKGSKKGVKIDSSPKGEKITISHNLYPEYEFQFWAVYDDNGKWLYDIKEETFSYIVGENGLFKPSVTLYARKRD